MIFRRCSIKSKSMTPKGKLMSLVKLLETVKIPDYIIHFDRYEKSTIQRICLLEHKSDETEQSIILSYYLNRQDYSKLVKFLVRVAVEESSEEDELSIEEFLIFLTEIKIHRALKAKNGQDLPLHCVFLTT